MSRERGKSWKKPFRTLRAALKASQKKSSGEVYYVDGSKNIRIKLALLMLWLRIKYFILKLIGYDITKRENRIMKLMKCNNCIYAEYHAEHKDLHMRICTNKKSEVYNHWCTGVFWNGVENNDACSFFKPNKFTRLLMWVNQAKMKEIK